MKHKTDFINWYKWSLEIKDCDPAIFLTNYLFNRFEHNREQKLWISWIYGTTYHLPTAWIIWNEFPDMNLVDMNRLTQWNNNNYRRLRYQTDTKWNKGHLPQQFESYRSWIGNQSQESKFNSLITDNSMRNFDVLWREIKTNLHKFGRYSTWFYLQTLTECCNLDIEPYHLALEDHDGSRSHRNGLCYALDKTDWINKKLSTKELCYLTDESVEILDEVREEYPNTNFFDMETCLCSFKKLFRISKGRYLGYYLDRQAEEIQQCEKDGWNGIDWKPFWDAREETLNKKLLTNKINNNKMSLYIENDILDATELFEQKAIGLQNFMEL